MLASLFVTIGIRIHVYNSNNKVPYDGGEQQAGSIRLPGLTKDLVEVMWWRKIHALEQKSLRRKEL